MISKVHFTSIQASMSFQQMRVAMLWKPTMDKERAGTRARVIQPSESAIAFQDSMEKTVLFDSAPTAPGVISVTMQVSVIPPPVIAFVPKISQPQASKKWQHMAKTAHSGDARKSIVMIVTERVNVIHRVECANATPDVMVLTAPGEHVPVPSAFLLDSSRYWMQPC